MTRIIVDEVLRNKLRNFSEPLELCDASGQVLAQVLPQPNPADYEAWVPEFDEEELRRQEKSTTWYTTEEVLDHLKRLENR